MSNRLFSHSRRRSTQTARSQDHAEPVLNDQPLRGVFVERDSHGAVTRRLTFGRCGAWSFQTLDANSHTVTGGYSCQSNQLHTFFKNNNAYSGWRYDYLVTKSYLLLGVLHAKGEGSSLAGKWVGEWTILSGTDARNLTIAGGGLTSLTLLADGTLHRATRVPGRSVSIRSGRWREIGCSGEFVRYRIDLTGQAGGFDLVHWPASGSLGLWLYERSTQSQW